jgi:acyl carrier protein
MLADMTSTTIEEIKKLVALQFGVRHVKETDRFMEDLGAESADVANLIAAVEEKYQIEIKESEIARIFTPADLFNLVHQRL